MPDPLDWLDDALADLDRRSQRRTLAERIGPQRGDKIELGGQSLVNFGSNDYLGLAADSRVIAAARLAIDENGWGAGASPLVTGHSALHAQLERGLAAFEGTEAALLFPSGYAANVGTITSLVGKGDAVYSDELNHASIIDGCRLSGAAIHIFPHSFPANSRNKDLQRLDELLRQGEHFRRRLIVTDSLFSMHGDFAPLAGLAKLAGEHDAMLLVDEAHATGIFGNSGRGLCEQDGVEDVVHVRVGTLSKSLGSQGGFVVGSQKLIDWLTNRARSYIFSTAPASAVAAAALAALEIVRKEPERRERLLAMATELRRTLIEAEVIEPSSQCQIIPVIVGDPSRALSAAADLRQSGFFVPAIRPPSVPEGQSLLRISLTCLHTEEHVNNLIAALSAVLK